MSYFAKSAILALMAAGTAQGAMAQGQPDSMPKAFGARETVISASLSPDNVDISQAKIMQAKLEGAGKRSQLVIYDGLEHSLVDSDVRADLLQKSADFLLAAGK